MTFTRRSALACAAAAVAFTGLQATSVLAADAWPSHPIHFVVPFGPGGANDLLARAAAEGASKALGQPIVVDNKPGAGAVLGTDIVAKAAPDGYTFLISAAGVISNSMIRKVPYKDSDLVPVAMIGARALGHRRAGQLAVQGPEGLRRRSRRRAPACTSAPPASAARRTSSKAC